MTQGFDLYNDTGHALRVTKLTDGAAIQGGGPRVGSVLAAGQHVHYEVIWKVTVNNTVSLNYQSKSDSTATYTAQMSVQLIIPAAWVQCSASSGHSCTPAFGYATTIKFLS